MLIVHPQAVEYCVDLTDGYATRGLCHVLEVRINTWKWLMSSLEIKEPTIKINVINQSKTEWRYRFVNTII